MEDKRRETLLLLAWDLPVRVEPFGRKLGARARLRHRPRPSHRRRRGLRPPPHRPMSVPTVAELFQRSTRWIGGRPSRT